jgi:hypothetical protein
MDVRVHGLEQIKLRLPGKLAADLYPEARGRLNVTAGPCSRMRRRVSQVARHGGLGQLVGARTSAITRLHCSVAAFTW